MAKIYVSTLHLDKTQEELFQQCEYAYRRDNNIPDDQPVTRTYLLTRIMKSYLNLL